MNTLLIKLDKHNVNHEKLNIAAKVIKDGGLVAFPTETVYGLGANALNAAAVQNIFIAKGRPNDNPLIVHIADRDMLEGIVEVVPENAIKLMDKFWPGPLTIIMKKAKAIPKIITAGLDTVAVRMPAHPVALALIKDSGFPIAAPSANTSGKPSPTNAKHVIEDLWGKADVIIDAGAAKVGLESTVIDVTVEPPIILRHGGIILPQLEEVIGEIEIDPAIFTDNTDICPKSPGMKYLHYAPKAEMTIVKGEFDKVAEKINQLIIEYSKNGQSVGVLATDQTREKYVGATVISLGDRGTPNSIAANLFYSLREFDKKMIQIILAEAVEEIEIGVAIMDRMYKAAGNKVIHVK